MTALYMFLLLVAVAAGAYFVFRGGATATEPDCTVAQAWERFVDGDGARTTAEKQAAAHLGSLGTDETERLKGRLQEIEERFRGEDGRTRLREATMDLTDRAMFAEAIMERQAQEGEEIDEQLIRMSRDRLAQAGVLRCLAGLKFRDRAAEDWYTHYVKLARLNVANVATMVDRTTHGDRPELESNLHTPLSHTIGQMREELLKHPPGQPVRTHTPISVESVEVASPGQLTGSQIKQLSTLLKARINRIMLGELYADEETVLEPGRAFELDAALLFALLGDRLDDPGKDWRQVIDLAFQSYEGEGLIDDLDRLEDKGRQLRSVWRDNKDNGPLQRALEYGYSSALGTHSSQSDALTSPPLRVVEDAGDLLRDLQSILGRS